MVTQVLHVRDMPNLLHTALSLSGSNYYGMKGYFRMVLFYFRSNERFGIITSMPEFAIVAACFAGVYSFDLLHFLCS